MRAGGCKDKSSRTNRATGCKDKRKDRGKRDALRHTHTGILTLSVIMGHAREVRFAMLAGEIRSNAGIPCSPTFRG